MAQGKRLEKALAGLRAELLHRVWQFDIKTARKVLCIFEARPGLRDGQERALDLWRPAQWLFGAKLYLAAMRAYAVSVHMALPQSYWAS